MFVQAPGVVVLGFIVFLIAAPFLFLVFVRLGIRARAKAELEQFKRENQSQETQGSMSDPSQK